MAEVVTRDSLAAKWKVKVEEEEGGTYAMTRARDDVRWFFDEISTALAKGDEVRIHGFGNFRIQQRAARMGRNPRTGEEVRVPARKVVRFAPSTSLSASLKSAGGRGKR
ncbi:MAG TPA: HU family DNA-binding protein [Candidatus Binatia bacterium]|nr:HU family DNA-binding protein [Candidatus Binatia bacterium]